MPTYRLTAGTHRTPDGDRAEAGETIEIPESVAEDFGNKFERVDDEELDADSNAIDTDEDDDATVEAMSEDAYEELEAEIAEEVGDVDDSPDGASDEDIGDTEAAGDIPEDYAILSKMAKHYDGEEIHGAKSGDEIRQFLSSLSDSEVASLKQQAQTEMGSG